MPPASLHQFPLTCPMILRTVATRCCCCLQDVFGAKADRVVIVAQGQAVWPLTSDKILKCRNATAHIDALAVGPYFGTYDPKRDTSVATFLGSTVLTQVGGTGVPG